MSATEITTLFVLCAAMSFSPGPNTTMATALAANGGMRQALRFCIAVPAGWSLMMMACGFGLGALVLGSPPLRLGIKLLGIGYMVWLAWKLSRAAQFASVDARRLNVGFWSGVGLQFVNIKAWMLALTLTAGWVVSAAGQPANNPVQRVGIICAVMLVFGLTSCLAYALMGALLRGFLAQGQRLLWFNRLLALVLLLTAAWMATV
jgi:threonine/homoserine/homoserine lactone efflux protein